MNSEEILKKARTLIQKGWCQGYMAKDTYGAMVDPFSQIACKWCVVGALHVAGVKSYGPWAAMYSAVGGDNNLARWNDTPGRTKEEVLEAFDRAIEQVRE